MKAEPHLATAPSHEDVSCVHAETCGGCPLIHLPYPEQLAEKRARVVGALSRFPALELTYTSAVEAAKPISHYRTRAKLMVGAQGAVGLYARGGGHQLVDIEQCQVLAPTIVRAVDAIRSMLRDGASAFGELGVQEQGGALRAIDVREVIREVGAESRLLVTLVTSQNVDMGVCKRAAEALVARVPEVAGVSVNFHDGQSPQVLGTKSTHVFGVNSLFDALGRTKHLATFGSFAQAHRGQALAIHNAVFEHIKQLGKFSTLRILDLYGGSGAFALALATEGASVKLIESFAPAVEQARRAAEKLGLVIEAECADTTDALKLAIVRKESHDSIIVNPPRRGVSPFAREAIAQLSPQSVVYVSCNPDTLARDLDHFTRLGYAAASIKPFDMIPLTDEVETLAILRKAQVPPPRTIHEDEDILVVEKAAYEPAVGSASTPLSLTSRVRTIPGMADAVCVTRVDLGTSGLVVFVKRPDLLDAWTKALDAESARRIYIAVVRGITPQKGAITRELRDGSRVHAARTRYRRLAVSSGHSVLRVIPEQERPHQLRRHLSAVGHAVLGDERYGHSPTNRYFEEKNGLDRLFLHCVRVEFEHVRTGQKLIVEAPLPGELRGVLEKTSGAATLKFLEGKNALGHGGSSSLPPTPDEFHDRGSALDVSATPTIIDSRRSSPEAESDGRASVIYTPPLDTPLDTSGKKDR